MSSLQFASRLISASFFAVSIISILLQVVFRYLLQWPLGWTSEVAINAFLVGTWWTICFNVQLTDHVKIGLLFDHLPVRAQKICQVIACTFAGCMLFLALPGCLKYLEVVNRLVTGVLKVPLSWIYVVFALFLVVVGGRLLFSAFRGLRSLSVGGAK
jgi:TRAP-type C4-dicarboxylate transport system permease small subunit